LRPVSAEKVIKALSKIGFQPGEELGRGILMEILNDAGLSKEEFIELLDQI